MRRRETVIGVMTAISLGVTAARAQRLPVLGLLIPSPRFPEKSGPLDLFLAGLAQLGYEDGRNISLEYSAAGYSLERLPELARELVVLEPDVIWTYSSGAARAAAAATTAIPIVVAPVTEATLLDLVGNWQRPVGNITGLTNNDRQLHEKCLQLLKETVPGISRVAVLVNPLNPAWDDYPGSLAEATRGLRIELIRIEAVSPDGLDLAFAPLGAAGIDGVLMPSGSVEPLAQVMALLMQRKLPTVTDSISLFRAGALLALSPDGAAIGQGAARYVDRILRGAKPSELPVEHPNLFKLMLNSKSAAALGLTFPPAVMLRADEVIE